MKYVFALMSLALVSGACATFNNVLGPEKIDPAAVSSNEGVVVLSAGAASRCIKAATQLNLALAGVPYGRSGIHAINVDNYTIKSDFPTHQGNLSVFVLKAGSYQLYPSTLNAFVQPTQVPKAEFSVKTGEVVYIGEYFMEVACQFTETFSTFRDQEARDIALLRQRNPRFGNRPVTKRLASFTGYILGGEKK
jgi:hypothetical protein